jgi:hypothetical protein
MDFVTELINQSTDEEFLKTRKAPQKAEPMFGIPQTTELNAGADLFVGASAPLPVQQFNEQIPVVGNIQRFSEPAVVQETVVAKDPTPNPAPPVMPAMTIANPENKEVFSEYNPLGSTPPGLRPSNSCMKCKYFYASYSDCNSYKLDRLGHCSEYDFPCMAGYVCNSFEMIEPSKPAEAEVYSDKSAAEALLEQIHTKEAPETKQPEPEPTPEPKSPAEPEPESSATAAAAEPEPVVKEEPAPIKEPEKSSKEEVTKLVLKCSDKELYSEAIKITRKRFRKHDSSIAQMFCEQKYLGFYKQKHGTADKAFITDK